MYVRALEESSTERWQMERRNVCQRRKLRNVFHFFKLFFCILVEDGIWLEVC